MIATDSVRCKTDFGAIRFLGPLPSTRGPMSRADLPAILPTGRPKIPVGQIRSRPNLLWKVGRHIRDTDN